MLHPPRRPATWPARPRPARRASALAALVVLVAGGAPALAGPDFVARDLRARPLAASDGRAPIPPSEDVAFAIDSAELLASSHQQLETVARWLRAHPGYRLILEGHADASGDAAYNDELAERRAEAVRLHLRRHGVPPERLTIIVFGEARARDVVSPIDRRVVIHAVELRGGRGSTPVAAR